MLGYWWYKFNIEDRDVGVVDYETLETANIKLPLLSLCIKNPFLEKRLKDIDPTINNTFYLQYLKGEIYAETYGQIDYENVTIDLDDYMFIPLIKMFNDTQTHWAPDYAAKTYVTFNGMYGTWDDFVKCFAVELDNDGDLIKRGISEVTFIMMLDKLIADLPITKDERYPKVVFFKIHYPQQFLLDVNLDRYSYIRTLEGSGLLFLTIKNLEVIKTRNKRTRMCVPDWMPYDSTILKKHVKRHGCTAPYQKRFGKFAKCTSKEEIKDSLYRYDIIRKMFPKACQRISKIDITSRFQGPFYLSGPKLGFRIIYPEDVKIITQSKEVDVHSLIGNVGGYIGLFLGKDV